MGLACADLSDFIKPKHILVKIIFRFFSNYFGAIYSFIINYIDKPNCEQITGEFVLILIVEQM